jgi:hypothetical protein
MGVPHVYNSRTAWALLQLDAIAPHEGQQRIARANLDWALSQQRGGYFDNCAFSPGKAPYTHTIAYAIRGLLESGRLLREPRYLEAAEVAARALLDHVRDDGFIPGQIDTAGKAQARYCCLTGNCQLAIIWAKLFDGGGGGDPGTGGGDVRFQRAATLALDYVMGCQDVDTRDANVRGAIKGSHPIWGRYAPFSYPNWATKFFVDALMLRSKWKI